MFNSFPFPSTHTDPPDKPALIHKSNKNLLQSSHQLLLCPHQSSSLATLSAVGQEGGPALGIDAEEASERGRFDAEGLMEHNYFRCEGDGRHLPNSVLCNHVVDCLLGEDEVKCGEYLPSFLCFTSLLQK